MEEENAEELLEEDGSGRDDANLLVDDGDQSYHATLTKRKIAQAFDRDQPSTL